MKKKFLRGRWKVAGIYIFNEVDARWEYDCEYFIEKAVWKFDRHNVTCCHSNGEVVYSVPYTILRYDRLLIDHGISGPNCGSYFEVYHFERLDGDLYLVESTLPSSAQTRQAIKLSPEYCSI